jgi:hypothetical protein
MLSKLSRRTVLIAALVVAIGSVSAVAVAAAHHSGHAAHHHQFGAAGWVTANGGSTLTLRDGRARSHTFDTPSTTKFVYSDRSAATSADAKPGTVVSVRATKPTTTGGNPVAKRVVIHLAHLAGLVQSNTGGVITISDTQGFTRSINTSGATCSQGGSTVACSSIVQNSVVAAKGKVDADGTTLDATRVRSRAPH